MRYIYKNPENCPVTNIMSVLGGRWKFIVVYTLIQGPRRFGQVKNMIPSISKKVLTEMFRELEEDQIILRTEVQQGTQVNVSYSLTEKAQGLIPVLQSMAAWGEEFSAQE